LRRLEREEWPGQFVSAVMLFSGVIRKISADTTLFGRGKKQGE
jgi:hypothetical protein